MDTIDLVPDSINRHDSEQLPRIFSLALQKKHRYERSQRLWWAQLAAASTTMTFSLRSNPLTGVDACAAQDREVRARLARL